MLVHVTLHKAAAPAPFLLLFINIAEDVEELWTPADGRTAVGGAAAAWQRQRVTYHWAGNKHTLETKQL